MKTYKIGTLKTDAIEFLEAFVSLTGCVFTRGYIEEEDLGLAFSAIQLLEKAEAEIEVSRKELKRMISLAEQDKKALEEYRSERAALVGLR